MTITLPYTYAGYLDTEFLQDTEIDVTMEIRDEDDYGITELHPTTEPAKAIWETMRNPQLGLLDLSARLERENQLAFMRKVAADMRDTILDDEKFMAIAFREARDRAEQARADVIIDRRDSDREAEEEDLQRK